MQNGTRIISNMNIMLAMCLTNLTILLLMSLLSGVVMIGKRMTICWGYATAVKNMKRGDDRDKQPEIQRHTGYGQACRYY